MSIKLLMRTNLWKITKRKSFVLIKKHEYVCNFSQTKLTQKWIKKKKSKDNNCHQRRLASLPALTKASMFRVSEKNSSFWIKLLGKRQKKRNMGGNHYGVRNKQSVPPLVINLFKAGIACRLAMNKYRIISVHASSVLLPRCVHFLSTTLFRKLTLSH